MRESKQILLVEDDHADVLIAKKALEELEITNELVHASDGRKALEYLQNGGHAKTGLILLDLNMPRMTGLEFLEVVKSKEELKFIPVVVLTTSTYKQDIVESFKHGVVGYMVKPIKYEEFVDIVKTIHHFWTLGEQPNA